MKTLTVLALLFSMSACSSLRALSDQIKAKKEESAQRNWAASDAKGELDYTFTKCENGFCTSD